MKENWYLLVLLLLIPIVPIVAGVLVHIILK